MTVLANTAAISSTDRPRASSVGLFQGFESYFIMKVFLIKMEFPAVYNNSHSELFVCVFWLFELSDYGFESHSAYERMSLFLCVVFPFVDVEVLCYHFIDQRFWLAMTGGGGGEG
jgi:hypothetical protein